MGFFPEGGHAGRGALWSEGTRRLCLRAVWTSLGGWAAETMDPGQVDPGEQQREKRLSRDTGAPCTKHVWRIWAAWEGG